VRDREVVLVNGAVEPCRCRDVVRDRACGDDRYIGRVETAGLGETLGYGGCAGPSSAAFQPHESMQRAAEVDGIEPARRVLRARCDREPGVEQLFGRETALAVVDEAPDPAADEVAEDIPSRELRDRRAAIDVAAGDGLSERARVVVDGVDRIR